MEEVTYEQLPKYSDYETVLMTKDHLLVMALASVWGREERSCQAMTYHVFSNDMETVRNLMESVAELGETISHSLLVVEIKVHFPGLNIQNQHYVAVISKSYFLLSKCEDELNCLHYQWFKSHHRVEESYNIELEFGISIFSLVEAAKSRIPDFTIDDLSSILHEANVFFSPVSEMDTENYCMVPTSQTHADLPKILVESPAEMTHANKRKIIESSYISNKRINLVGLFNSPTLLSSKHTHIKQDNSEPLEHQDISINEHNSNDEPIPLEDIHKTMGQCKSKYTYYGTHDNILDEGEVFDTPLMYDDSGRIQLSEKQKKTLDRIVKTVGTSQNSWKYCCQIFFKKFPNIVPKGSRVFDKDVLEVYLKVQYFAQMKKTLEPGPLSEDENIKVMYLQKTFWANSSVVCNHFSMRSEEQICKAMEKFSKTAEQIVNNSFSIISIRIVPDHLKEENERKLEHLQEEISCLVCANSTDIFVLPCKNSSIICPHRAFSKVPEYKYSCNFQEFSNSGEINTAFCVFLKSIVVRELGFDCSPIYKGEYLSAVMKERVTNMYKLPVKTLFRLNGLKRLKDAGFDTEEHV